MAQIIVKAKSERLLKELVIMVNLETNEIKSPDIKFLNEEQINSYSKLNVNVINRYVDSIESVLYDFLIEHDMKFVIEKSLVDDLF